MDARNDLRIGYVPFELFHTYWAICMHGVKTRAAELGVDLVLPSVSADEDILAAVADLAAKRVDAVILPGNLVVRMDSFQVFDSASIPVIVAEFAAGPPCACAVHTNELQGANAVV